MTASLQSGETMNAPPACAMASTSSGASTVPAPIEALPASSLTATRMDCRGCGELSGISMRLMPASTSTWQTAAVSVAVMPRRIAMRWRCLASMGLPFQLSSAGLLAGGHQSRKARRMTIDNQRLLALSRHGLTVKLNETGAPDDGEIAPSEPLPLRADLSADEQARQIARAPIGRASRQQSAGPDLEQHGRQPLWCVDSHGQPALEALGVVGSLTCSDAGVSQHRMGAQHFKQFPRLDRCEALHATAGKYDPFAMGSGHADDAAEMGKEGGEPEQLGLLPAHDILGPVAPLAHARQDACPEAPAGPSAGPWGSHGSCRKGGKIGRRVEVGRLHPALARAGHATDQGIERRAGG